MNGFVQNSSFKTALEKLTFSNDIKVSQSEDGFYVFEKRSSEGDAALKNNLALKLNAQQQGSKQTTDEKYAGITVLRRWSKSSKYFTGIY